MARAHRRTSADTSETTDAGEFTANLNEIVAYNFRRARELRGLTQDEAALALEPYLGQRLPQASISAIERAFGRERRREFDAQEILAFAQDNGMSALSMWAIQRDNGGCPGSTGSNDCSGIVQGPWEFSATLNAFTGP